ncbi:MAG: hypothetical protein AMS25_07885 [Gemmatimonas sp. SM23_52]|nr:MAG: hypothetical protein AMS25_07885 [Gemmatimonas sp. SM23_52]
MNIRVAALGLTLALALVLSTSEVAVAQARQRAPRSRARALAVPLGQHGMGLRARALTGPGHVGPGLLLRLKSELELSNEQVGRLEKLQEDHGTAMETMRDRLAEMRESFAKARSERDWDALENAIDEFARLGAERAKSFLSLERESLGLLNDEQREKLDTLQGAARLLREQRFHRWQDMRRGRGLRWRRQPVPPPPPEG